MPYGWHICNFGGIAEARFCTNKGKDQIVLRPKKRPRVWDGPKVQGACHHVQRGVNGLSAVLGSQTLYMTIQRPGCLLRPFYLLLNVFLFFFDSHLTLS